MVWYVQYPYKNRQVHLSVNMKEGSRRQDILLASEKDVFEQIVLGGQFDRLVKSCGTSDNM